MPACPFLLGWLIKEKCHLCGYPQRKISSGTFIQAYFILVILFKNMHVHFTDSENSFKMNHKALYMVSESPLHTLSHWIFEPIHAHFQVDSTEITEKEPESQRAKRPCRRWVHNSVTELEVGQALSHFSTDPFMWKESDILRVSICSESVGNQSYRFPISHQLYKASEII